METKAMRPVVTACKTYKLVVIGGVARMSRPSSVRTVPATRSMEWKPGMMLARKVRGITFP